MEVNLISTFAEFKELKNIDRPTMMSVLENIFRTQLEKMYGSADNFDIIINIDKGDLEIWRNREVVEKVEDPNTQISLEEVHKIDPSYEVGEDFPEEVKLSDFGRRGILNLRQNLQGRIADIEKANLYNKYKDRIHEILVGEVYQVWKKEVLVMDEDGNELVLPKSEQIPSDYFKKGETVKAVIESVEMKNNTPVITLSRTSPAFLERLFEQEVPEIFDGLITIKKVVRIPGDRAKVAVESYDERIDPVGACVGVKGSRIHSIVRELRNENIDIINWTSNTQLLIQRALSPAKISSMSIDEETKHIRVNLSPSEVSLAIGKGGSNIKLAGHWQVMRSMSSVRTKPARRGGRNARRIQRRDRAVGHRRPQGNRLRHCQERARASRGRDMPQGRPRGGDSAGGSEDTPRGVRIIDKTSY